MVTIHNTITSPNGEPAVGARVEVRLIWDRGTSPIAAALNNTPPHMISASQVTETDSNGMWSMNVEAQEDLYPDCVYKITERVGNNVTTYHISVPKVSPNILGTTGTFDANIGTWQNSWGATSVTLTRNGSIGYNSLGCLQGTDNTGGSGTWNIDSGTGYSGLLVTPGTSYVIEASILAGTTSRPAGALAMAWMDSSSNYLSSSDIAMSSGFSTVGTWATWGGTVVAPANAHHALMQIMVYTTALNEVHYVDEVSVRLLPNFWIGNILVTNPSPLLY
jgi:hypothetical protein